MLLLSVGGSILGSLCVLGRDAESLVLWELHCKLSLGYSSPATTPPSGRPGAMIFGPTRCKSNWLIHPPLSKLPHAVKAFCPGYEVLTNEGVS